MIRSPSHLALIRTLPCAFCGGGPSEAAHVRTGTDGGMGLKPSDSWTVPLCHKHHAYQHQIGERAFWADRIDMVKALAADLWKHTDNPTWAYQRVVGWVTYEMGEE